MSTEIPYSTHHQNSHFCALESTEAWKTMPRACSDSESERAAVAARGGDVVASSRPCPVCGQAMTGRRASACSDKCRAAKSRRRRTGTQIERDQRVLALLAAAVQVLSAGR